MDLPQLKRDVLRAKWFNDHAYIDIAYEAKVSPMTVWRFLNGVTSTPTFLTRWGLRKYASKYKPRIYEPISRSEPARKSDEASA